MLCRLSASPCARGHGHPFGNPPMPRQQGWCPARSAARQACRAAEKPGRLRVAAGSAADSSGSSAWPARRPACRPVAAGDFIRDADTERAPAQRPRRPGSTGHVAAAGPSPTRNNAWACHPAVTPSTTGLLAGVTPGLVADPRRTTLLGPGRGACSPPVTRSPHRRRRATLASRGSTGSRRSAPRQMGEPRADTHLVLAR